MWSFGRRRCPQAAGVALRIQEIIAGKRGISPETALRLGRFFGNEPEFWLSMQASYDLAMLRKQMGGRIDAKVEAVA